VHESWSLKLIEKNEEIFNLCDIRFNFLYTALRTFQLALTFVWRIKAWAPIRVVKKRGGCLTFIAFNTTQVNFRNYQKAISCASWIVFGAQIMPLDLFRTFLAQKSFEQNGKTFSYLFKGCHQFHNLKAIG